MTRLRIGFLLPKYSRQSRSYMPRVLEELGALGVDVEVLLPAPGPVSLSQLRASLDLYVLRKMSGDALSLAGALHALGAAIVNPYPASAMLCDKIITTRMLEAAGVPVPETFVADTPGQLAPLLADGPLVVKPFMGAGGFDVRVIREPGDLVGTERSHEPVFAQRYHPPDGPDRKMYVIGPRIFGVMKVFPRLTHEERMGEPFVASPELESIARRCGRVFGIDLYGVDIIESGGRPYVVDMGSIPGFKGVPDAPRLLARYFRDAVGRAARGEPATPAPGVVEMAASR